MNIYFSTTVARARSARSHSRRPASRCWTGTRCRAAPSAPSCRSTQARAGNLDAEILEVPPGWLGDRTCQCPCPCRCARAAAMGTGCIAHALALPMRCGTIHATPPQRLTRLRAGIILRVWAETRWRPVPPPRVLVGLALVRCAPGACEGLPPRTAALLLRAISHLAGMLRPEGPAPAPEQEADGLGLDIGLDTAAEPGEPVTLAGGLASAAADRVRLLRLVSLQLEGRLEPLVAAALVDVHGVGLAKRGVTERLAEHLAMLVLALFLLHYQPDEAHVEAMAAATARVASHFHISSLMAVAHALYLWNAHGACPSFGVACAALSARLAELEEEGHFQSSSSDPEFIQILRTH